MEKTALELDPGWRKKGGGDMKEWRIRAGVVSAF